MPIMYHVSRADLGSTPTLTAQVPECSVPERESWKPRVCFAPTVEQCLLSLVAYRDATMADAVDHFLPRTYDEEILNPAVYTTRKRLTLPPQSKSDFKLTGERWSMSDIEVHKIGYLNLGVLIRGSQEFASDALSRLRFTKITLPEWKAWKACYTARHRRLRFLTT